MLALPAVLPPKKPTSLPPLLVMVALPAVLGVVENHAAAVGGGDGGAAGRAGVVEMHFAAVVGGDGGAAGRAGVVEKHAAEAAVGGENGGAAGRAGVVEKHGPSLLVMVALPAVLAALKLTKPPVVLVMVALPPWMSMPAPVKLSDRLLLKL